MVELSDSDKQSSLLRDASNYSQKNGHKDIYFKIQMQNIILFITIFKKSHNAQNFDKVQHTKK